MVQIDPQQFRPRLINKIENNQDHTFFLIHFSKYLMDTFELEILLDASIIYSLYSDKMYDPACFLLYDTE